MKKKYLKTEFEGYTHRFKVEFNVAGQFHTSCTDIYSNSDSYQELENFLNDNKSGKITKFKIVYRSSKEQDEATSKLIDGWLKDFK